MPETTPDVLVDHRDGVAIITLNRPEALNAWTPTFGADLYDAVVKASDDPDVRAILITGAGRAFSAGADLKSERSLTPDGEPDLESMLREIYNPIILAIREAPKPVIAAVNGAAAGIGCSLALACDLVVAAESAYFLLAFVRIGLGPDGGSTTHLMQRIGPARTAELMMLGERLPARQALDWGLINAVHPDAALAAEAFTLAARLATGPTVAIATAKTQLREAPVTPLADQLAREASLQQTHARTTDYVEGVTAFREKRPARFTGR